VERRGIASNIVFKERSIFRLAKNLQMKPKHLQSDEERIQDFQRRLYQKSKQEKEYKFYVLYDKICSLKILRVAYKKVKANKGSPGIDGKTFADIEEYGVGKYLAEIERNLKEKTYKPMPVLRVYIPKANGKMRPLGIPVIKDRVVQMACKMVIEPIFEADFEPCSFGFRPGKSAKDAIKSIKEILKEGKAGILDADLSAYFDTIPHEKLMILICKRISDKNVIHLIKMWLKCPVMENDKLSGGKKNNKGTPQGGVISPLLANIYLNLLDKVITNREIFKKAKIKLVRYADDFVLMGKYISNSILRELKGILKRMELTLNEEKTRVLNATIKPFNFLGFTFRFDRDLYFYKWKYWNIIPSDKSCKKARENISDVLKKYRNIPSNLLAEFLNERIRGWINYFSIKGVSYPKVAQKDLRQYLSMKLRRYYKRKSQRKCKLYNQNAFEVLVAKYGLIDPSKYTLSATCERLR
jgi:RNA-directed DNA polymerase